MRLTVTVILAALAAILPFTASADDVDEHGCPAGTTWTETAGVPLCLAPIWLDGTWHDDPRDCQWGYYQGSCAPEPTQPVVLDVEAYTFQMGDPAPDYIAEVEAKRTEMLAWEPATVAVATMATPPVATERVWLGCVTLASGLRVR